jgi:hypothetical protein
MLKAISETASGHELGDHVGSLVENKKSEKSYVSILLNQNVRYSTLYRPLKPTSHSLNFERLTRNHVFLSVWP